MTSLGLIAGNGAFPLAVARAAVERGIRLVIAAHQGESLPELARVGARLAWFKVGQLQAIVDFFKAEGIDCAAMAGGISRARLHATFAPDERALRMLSGLSRLSDDALLRAVATELGADAISVVDPVALLDGALAPRGLAAGPAPSAAQLEDLRLACSVLKARGPFDVGQTVAVCSVVVGAVEALEGTDRALERAAALCGSGFVAAKGAKPGQDLRFDRPAVGPATVELLSRLGAALLGLEAEKALILERRLTLETAERCGLTVYGYD